MAELQKEPQKLGQVLNRLEQFNAYESRPSQVKKLIGQFEDKNPHQQQRNKIIINEAVYDFQRFSNEEVVGNIAREKLQNVLVARLFCTNRQLYQEEGKTKYDFEKESRQIEAVIAALKGKHVHMGTGEGKSSTVIPITAIVEAITSKKKGAVVATASSTLLKDIFEKTELLSSSLTELNNLFSLDLDRSQQQQPQEFIDNKLFSQMEKEALLENSFSEKTKTKTTASYWQRRLLQPDEKEIGYKKSSQKPKISFATERDLIFDMSKDPKDFSEKCPRIFMDEADVSFNRKTPYVRTRKDRFVTSEEIQNSTYQWLFNYVVAKQINPDDFENFQGRFLLKDGLVEKLNLEFNENNNFFNGGLQIIAKKLGLSEEQQKLLRAKAHDYFEENKPNNENLSSYTQAIGDILAEMTRQKNRSYLMKKDGTPVIRDSYIDELLEEHENQPEYQLAILALNDRFVFVHLNQAISSAIRFPTFAAYAADKLVCFSGTLLYQGLRDKNLRLSSFAKFIRDITKKEVSLVSPPERKTIPVPELFDTTGEAETACVKLVLEPYKQPILIIDYEGVDHTQKIYDQIKTLREQKKSVVILPPKPSAPAEEEKYNQYLDVVTSDLAEGKIDVIVSSGTAGVGVNIVNKDGSFPDLRVIHFGIPEHEALISQGNGRRRAPGDDFAWYLSREILNSNFSYFSEEVADKLHIALGAVDQKKIKEMVDQAMDDPSKRLGVINEILKQKQRKEAENTNIMIEYDLYFQKIIDRFKKEVIVKLSQEFLPRKTDLDEKVFSKMITNYASNMGIPQSLYYEILKNHPLVPGGGGPKGHISNLNQLIFSESGWFSEQVGQWFDTNVQKIRDFDHLVMFDGKVVTDPFLVSLTEVSDSVDVVETNSVFPGTKKLKPVFIGDFVGMLKGNKKYFVVVDDYALTKDPNSNYSFLDLFSDQGQLALFTSPKKT